MLEKQIIYCEMTWKNDVNALENYSLKTFI